MISHVWSSNLYNIPGYASQNTLINDGFICESKLEIARFMFSYLSHIWVFDKNNNNNKIFYCLLIIQFSNKKTIECLFIHFNVLHYLYLFLLYHLFKKNIWLQIIHDMFYKSVLCVLKVKLMFSKLSDL